MSSYAWSRPNHIQVGEYGEQFVKTEFMRQGLDVRHADVDRRRYELIVRRRDGPWVDVLVRTVRGHNYIFFHKDRFVLRPDFLIAVVILWEGEPPACYLFPSEACKEPNRLLVGHDYEGKQSAPEWGISLSQRGIPLLGGARSIAWWRRCSGQDSAKRLLRSGGPLEVDYDDHAC
jgi:hypothetical protein